MSWSFIAVTIAPPGRRTRLRRGHQRDRQRQPGRAPQGRDPAAGLDGIADGSPPVPERSHGGGEDGGRKGEAPEERRTVTARPFDRLRRLLDDLEDDPAETEEGLTWGAGRGRLLADPAQVEAGDLECCDGALEVRRDDDQMIETRDA